LISAEAIKYVGQAANRVFARVADHKRQRRITFDRSVWIERAVKNLDYTEALYIRKFDPPHNVGLHRRKPQPSGAASGLQMLEKAL
jgi:hypothetical protein